MEYMIAVEDLIVKKEQNQIEAKVQLVDLVLSSMMMKELRVEMDLIEQKKKFVELVVNSMMIEVVWGEQDLIEG